MVQERTSAWQGRGSIGYGGERTSALQPGSAWNQARPATTMFGPPSGLSRMERPPASYGGLQKQDLQKQDNQGRKPHPCAIQSNPAPPNQSAWANKSKVPGQANRQLAQPIVGEARPGRQGGHGPGCWPIDKAQQGQMPKHIPPDNELNDYPDVRQQLAVPRGRGRGSKSPARSDGESADLSPDTSPRCSLARGRTAIQRKPTGRRGNFDEHGMNGLAYQMQSSSISEDPNCRTPSPQHAHHTREPQHLANLHKQDGVAQMVGEYNPSKPDPSHAMIRQATRQWDSDKLEYGCKLLMRGVGIKIAAREAGVIMGDLQAHWGTYYVDAESNGYEDSDSDGSPVPR